MLPYEQKHGTHFGKFVQNEYHLSLGHNYIVKKSRTKISRSKEYSNKMLTSATD